MKTKIILTVSPFRSTFLMTAIFLTLMPAVSYSQSGALDNSFGTGGIVTTPLNGTDWGYAVAIQSDGKIIVTGNSNAAMALVRYNTNGTLDNTFGTGGIVTGVFGSGNNIAASVAIQSDGKIVVAGQVGIFPSYDFLTVRYNTNGTPDNTFGTGGAVITPVGTLSDAGCAVALQSDGKILVGGNSENGSNNDLALVRYNTNGTPDVTFDSDGIVTTAVGTANDIIRTVVVQPDGNIVVGGYSFVAMNNYQFVLARYTTTGALDLTFDTDGIVLTDIIPSSNDYTESLLIQPDGKIVAAGYSFAGGNLNVTRYNTNGSLDNTFGTNGIVSTVFGTLYQNKYSAVLQSDGKILVGGYRNPGSGNSDFGLVRYNTNGSLDNTFGTSGIVTTPIGSSDDIGTSVAIQSDGKIVLAGRSYNGTNFDFTVVRYDNTNNTITGINTTEVQGLGIKIYPNPFSSYTTFQTDNIFKNATLTIYNSYGQTVKYIDNLAGQTIIFQRDNLPSGLYFFRLTENNKTLGIAKLVITD